MFEISWSELLILGAVTLIFVGPKELPVFLRTLGRYACALKRHASEFRAQFDAAMREAELDSMRKEVEEMQASVNAEVMSAKRSLDDVVKPSEPPRPAPPASTTPQSETAQVPEAQTRTDAPAAPRAES